jgi:hypothetical protein
MTNLTQLRGTKRHGLRCFAYARYTRYDMMGYCAIKQVNFNFVTTRNGESKTPETADFSDFSVY